MRLHVIALASVLVLAGCGKAVKPCVPAPPIIVEVPVRTFVPLDPKLTTRCKWTKEAPPSEVFSVSRGRKTCLEQYEGQFGAIEAVQGGTAP